MLDPARFPVVIQVTVAWGEMDAFQHVNNTAYLRWFESARIALFERVGWLGTDGKSGVGPILARQTAVYRAPLRFPDVVHVGVGVTELGADRFTMPFAVYSTTLGGVAAEGDGRIVSFDYGLGAKAPFPPAVRDALLQLSGAST
jgi:acyl-CoA thioester hydrolase